MGDWAQQGGNNANYDLWRIAVLIGSYKRFGITCATTQKIKALVSSQILVLIYQTTWRHIPENNISIYDISYDYHNEKLLFA